MKNKKGWIKIIESFVAVLLIMGILLLVLNQNSLQGDRVTSYIYNEEISILREIQLSSSYRALILTPTLPVPWYDFETQGLGSIKTKIIDDIPSNLDCAARLCAMNDVCEPAETMDQDVYVQQVTISADLTTYSPRQLKLFCWIK